MFKVSKNPWPWYRVAMLLFAIVVINTLVYGFAAPALMSAASWVSVALGFIVAVPVTLALNIYVARVTWNALKPLFEVNR